MSTRASRSLFAFADGIVKVGAAVVGPLDAARLRAYAVSAAIGFAGGPVRVAAARFAGDKPVRIILRGVGSVLGEPHPAVNVGADRGHGARFGAARDGDQVGAEVCASAARRSETVRAAQRKPRFRAPLRRTPLYGYRALAAWTQWQSSNVRRRIFDVPAFASLCRKMIFVPSLLHWLSATTIPSVVSCWTFVASAFISVSSLE